MKVYLVWTYGEVLDGVFKSREAAERYIKEDLEDRNYEVPKSSWVKRDIYYIEEWKVQE